MASYPGGPSSSGDVGSASCQSPAGGTSAARKQLPSLPSEESPGNGLAKPMVDIRLLKQRGPLFLEYSLMAEYKQLEKQKLPGVYVIPSAKSPLCWNGVLFLRQGIYQGGVFKFLLLIPENYPDGDCPRVVFDIPIFHPLVAKETGELDVKRAFEKWRRNVNHLWQVLLYTRRVFYKIDTKSPLNVEAASLYEEEPETYKSRVAETIALCQERLYDPPPGDDPHAISFSEWNPEIHEGVKHQMSSLKKSQTNDNFNKSAQTSGLSWMSPDGPFVFTSESSPS